MTPTQQLPEWVQITAALLTPTVAIAVGVIAFLQWRTNQNKLRLDLFERRYAVFKAVGEFIGAVMKAGTTESEAMERFASRIGEAKFLFDQSLGRYIDEVYRRGIEMLMLDSFSKDNEDVEERKRMRATHSENLRWLLEQSPLLATRFSPYLQLKH